MSKLTLKAAQTASPHMIKIDGKYDLRKLVFHAFRLSKPSGFGLLRKRGGDLSEKDIDNFIREKGETIVRMDSVYGRDVKFMVFKTKDGMFINDHWFHHTAEEFAELLECSKYRTKIQQHQDKEHQRQLLSLFDNVRDNTRPHACMA
jgi:hypothetical protein